MEIAWLKDFVAIANLRSFSKAAQAQHATQSAVSRRIKALEDWYGVALVDRSSYPVTLTKAGSHLVPIAQALIADLYRSRREARAEADAEGRRLHFTMPHSLASGFFPHWWRQCKQGRDLDATVTAADLWNCVEMLLNGDAQFLVCYSHREVASGLENVNLRRLRVGQEKLIPVTAIDTHQRPLYNLMPGACELEIPLLTYPSQSFLGKVTSHMHAWLESQYTLHVRYESAYVEAIKAETLLGEGIAWLPERLVANELAAARLARLGDDLLAIELDIWLCSSACSTIPAYAEDLFSSAQTQESAPRGTTTPQMQPV
ncbi:LysR family transcriptional regulator [Alcaligenes sp.]|uniref:LysR family transcriptional regulator n=1 Tax=Alcaligenes sp. TaxID=512 RepID=UPI003B688DF5|nr:LysR family transcriptional regulator [Klebsiella pneumoniae]